RHRQGRGRLREGLQWPPRRRLQGRSHHRARNVGPAADRRRPPGKALPRTHPRADKVRITNITETIIPMDRRKFVQGAATASGLLFVKPETLFSYSANSRVRWGLLGCGRRGTSVATSFAKNAGVEITALADIFPDQLATAKKHFDEISASLNLSAID